MSCESHASVVRHAQQPSTHLKHVTHMDPEQHGSGYVTKSVLKKPALRLHALSMIDLFRNVPQHTVW